MNEIIVNKKSDEVQICIMENNQICEVYTYGKDNENIIGNVYLGKVKNVVDGMQAAFIDIGFDKNAFIPVKDTIPKVDIAKEKQVIDAKISDILKVGDKVLVQVKKMPTLEKGARVSTHITLPGNYIVLMPDIEIITASQKIENEEVKTSLLKITKELLPKGFGAIIRTDAEDASKEKIKEDIKELIEKWKVISSKFEKSDEVGLVYNEHELVSKVSRDLINKNSEKLYTNDSELFEKMKKHLKGKKVEIVNVETEDLIDEFGLLTELGNALERKIWLNCGGYIVIDKTEALTAIDVNSGKCTGKENMEATALEVNMEAAVEIIKQIRLRDIGGIIIIDYIDLKEKEDQEKILEVMHSEAKKDRSKIDIKGYTKLNLVELTRKKMI